MTYMTDIVLVIGTRPNFIKALGFVSALSEIDLGISWRIVATDQHDDPRLSTEILSHKIPKEKLITAYTSETNSGKKVGEMIQSITECIQRLEPSLVVVFGDVNSALAGAISAKKVGVKLAHIEAGLRSFNNIMDEENNRILIDHLSDFHFVSEPSGLQNLANEGILPKHVYFVGNIMIDSLNLYSEESQDISKTLDTKIEKFVGGERFGLLTLHRKELVDIEQNLRPVISAINEISKDIKLIFPIHPRTRSKLSSFSLELSKNVLTTSPLIHKDFVRLLQRSSIVFTDSGGLQEETTYLGIPCITLRNDTERPITCSIGTNRLVGTQQENIIAGYNQIKETNLRVQGECPEYWDGQTAKRIIEIMFKLIRR